MEDVKIKLAVLWIFIAVATATAIGLVLLDDLLLGEIIPEEVDPATAAGMGLLLFIWVVVPMTMAFLSLTLKGSTNRWANIVLGMFFTVFNFLGFTDNLINLYPIHDILIEAVKVVVSALIVWYAWKLPKKGA